MEFGIFYFRSHKDQNKVLVDLIQEVSINAKQSKIESKKIINLTMAPYRIVQRDKFRYTEHSLYFFLS